MTQPRITIGMVVRNGERHIAQAIESFLAQTLGDFILVVHDNASTDQTADIVRSFAKRDDRVRLVRRPRDVGVVRNLIEAAEAATTPLFCWAACDDLREPAFLERMVALLDGHADASLACCAVRNIDPDGTPRDIRPETASLRTATGQTASRRLRLYLREMPGTPFYGVFRTPHLQASLGILREMDALAGNGPPLLGLDMIFLARFVREHGLAYDSTPLLLFRRGGISHHIDRFGSTRAYFRHLRLFNSRLREAARMRRPLRCRFQIGFARRIVVLRWLCGAEMRRMTWHYLLKAVPGAVRLRSRLARSLDPAMRRLRARLANEPAGARIVLLGAGKHTRRRLQELRMAIGRRASLIAVCDDHADLCTPLADLRIVPVSRLAELAPDIVLISSDAYEQALHRRALAIAPPSARVWCLYDPAIEQAAQATSASTASTPATNAAISAKPSTLVAAR